MMRTRVWTAVPTGVRQMTGRDIERTVREVANSEGHWVSPADRGDDGDFGDPRYWNRKGGPREEADMALMPAIVDVVGLVVIVAMMAVSLAILVTVIAKVWL